MTVAVAGIAMVSPLLPVYVRDDLGGPEVAVALAFSAISLSQIIASPVVGPLGDRFGTKRFIVTGFVLYGLGAFGYVVAPNWQVVVAFRAFSGLGAAAIFPMAQAYVGRIAPPGKEGQFMGVFSTSWIAGFGLGPLLGGAIRDIVSADAAFLTMALMLFVVGLLTWVLLPARPPRPGVAPGEEDDADGPALPLREVLRRPIVQAATAGQVTVSFGWGAGFTFIAVYVVSEEGLNTDSATFVGVLLAARALFSAAMQMYTGRLADRTSRVTLSLVGFGLAGVAQFVIPDVPGTMFDLSLFGGDLVVVPWLLVLFLLIGLGEAIEFPAQQAIFVDAGRAVGMGAVMGITQTGGAAGFLVGSLAGAGVVEVFGLEAVFRYAGLTMLLGVGVFYLLMRRARGDFQALAAADRERLAARSA